MRILALETSGGSFSVALSENGVVVSENLWDHGRANSERLIPALESLVDRTGWEKKSINKIAVTTGPGSFTGIRVGLSCAKTLAQGINIPIVAVTTLELLMKMAPEGKYKVFPAINALRGEVFVFNSKGEIEIRSSKVVWEQLKKQKKDVCIVGDGFNAYQSEIKEILGSKLVNISEKYHIPHAGVLSLVAEKCSGKSFTKIEPAYVRKTWAEERK